MGLLMIMLALIVISLPLPADSSEGPSCVDIIGVQLVDTISARCLFAFFNPPKPDPVAEKECCQAMGKGLELSRGNRCLCTYVNASPARGRPTLAELCKLGDMVKQICAS
jgi:hypothetical protein